ncbi:unnamed protein product [Adineta steineri]|uniref:Pentapeptide repeat-containing protein n=1 Tax=Adineta steineri TaxID=433720 RepID=A0A814BN03_9BILA|nr:unnamed protein product [Adineta steineri]
METHGHNSLVHKQIKEIRLEEIVTMNISAIYSNDNREVTPPMEKKEKQQEYRRRRRRPQQYTDYGHTRFEWIQLIATLTVPIAIAIFTILDSVQQMNQSKNQFNVQLRIAAENRETDLHIASENRQKDLDIASENRWKDYKIAEETRLKDREVADDEQKHSMLIDHQTFLSKLILKEGVHLNNTNYEAARFVARFKTLIAFRQLDPKRKTRLFKSLYVGKLAGRLDEDMAIDLSSADLSNIDFASPRDHIALTPPSSHPYYSVNFSDTNLKNASFNSVSFFNVSFVEAMMDDVIMLSTLTALISFRGASLLRAKFLYSHYININFGTAKLDGSFFEQFECDQCSFNFSSLIGIRIQNSKFVNSTFTDTKIDHSFITETEFSNNVNMRNVSLTNSKIHNCTFIGVDMRQCEMHGSSLLNSKFIKVNFDECKGLTIEQLKQADIVSESVLPNGTVYSSN